MIDIEERASSSDTASTSTSNGADKPSRAAPRSTKSATVLKLLSRNRGATLAEIMAVTNWQPHSSRAFLSGLRKKGTELLRETRRDGDTSYRIEAR